MSLYINTDIYIYIYIYISLSHTMPLSAMELQALLNRRQPRKRPAGRQTVDLVSSDSEPEQDGHRCQLPQPQGFKMESTLWSQKKVMRQELYPGTSRAN